MSVKNWLVSLDLVYGNVSGKQAICIHLAEAKHKSFFVHSPRDIKYHSLIPQITINAIYIKKQFSLHTVCILQFASKMNV